MEKLKHPDVKKLLKQHGKLNQTDRLKVVSHVQRRDGDWFINTIMVEGYDVPFRYKRKQEYQQLKGCYVNLTYYSDTETVAGIDMQVMTVVRIRKS